MIDVHEQAAKHILDNEDWYPMSPNEAHFLSAPLLDRELVVAILRRYRGWSADEFYAMRDALRDEVLPEDEREVLLKQGAALCDRVKFYVQLLMRKL